MKSKATCVHYEMKNVHPRYPQDIPNDKHTKACFKFFTQKCVLVLYIVGLKGKKLFVNKNFYLKILKAFKFLIKCQEFN
jgi:hypothetical protein